MVFKMSFKSFHLFFLLGAIGIALPFFNMPFTFPYKYSVLIRFVAIFLIAICFFQYHYYRIKIDENSVEMYYLIASKKISFLKNSTVVSIENVKKNVFRVNLENKKFLLNSKNYLNRKALEEKLKDLINRGELSELSP